MQVDLTDPSPEPAGMFERALARREAWALERFYDLWFPRVWGFVRGRVGDEGAAEDLTHDIFLHVYEALETYDAGRPLRPWVFTIAANKLRDWFRTRARRGKAKSLEAGLAEELRCDDELRPDAPLARTDERELVRAAVAVLPPSMRSAVELRLFEGCSFEAAGERLDRNATAVRKRYSRALKELREVLAPALGMA